MRIKKGNSWKTALKTRDGHFKYQVIAYNIFKAPASFKSYINKILVKKLDIFIIIYIKNSNRDYINAVKYVLKDPRKHKLFANLKSGI